MLTAYSHFLAVAGVFIITALLGTTLQEILRDVDSFTRIAIPPRLLIVWLAYIIIQSCHDSGCELLNIVGKLNTEVVLLENCKRS